MHSQYKSHRKLWQVLWDHPKSRKRGNVPPSHQHLIRQAAISSAQIHHQLVILVIGSPCHGQRPFSIWYRNRHQKMGREFQGNSIGKRNQDIQESFTKTTYHTVFTLLLLMDLQSSNMDQHRENTRLSRKVEICRLNFWPAPFLTKQEQELAELSRCPQKSIPSNTSICTTQKSIDIQI